MSGLQQVAMAAMLSSVVSALQDYTAGSNPAIISLAATPPLGASAPIGPAFVSFSVEWASFPDYAGNGSHPNLYSSNLLSNIAAYQGVMPYIRVGGVTQDYALQDGYLQTAFRPIKSATPGVIEYGYAYWESFKTLPKTKYIYGFNLAKNTAGFRQNLWGGISGACMNITDDQLLYWELGNEPDRYDIATSPSVPANTRPASSWNEASFANEWLSTSRTLKDRIGNVCPDRVSAKDFRLGGPGFSSTTDMDPVQAFNAMNKDNDMAEFSSHSYMTQTPNDPAASLANTLMNHASTVKALTPQIQLAARVRPALPFALTQTDSVPAPGKKGVTNVFGAALWALDFDLLAASGNISRVHAHQTTDSLSSSWQPIRSTSFANGPQTLPQYYGHVAAAAFVGPSATHPTQIVNIGSTDPQFAIYAAYVHTQLARVMLINLSPSQSTPQEKQGTTYAAQPQSAPRPSTPFTLKAPTACQGAATISRLWAPGHDSTTGVSWDGFSYEASLGQGRPAVMQGRPRGETVAVGKDGGMMVDVENASAVMLTFDCSPKQVQGYAATGTAAGRG